MLRISLQRFAQHDRQRFAIAETIISDRRHSDGQSRKSSKRDFCDREDREPDNHRLRDEIPPGLLARLPMQEPDHAPRHGRRVLFAAQSHLKALPILFRQYAQRRCATSGIDLQIAKYFVNGANWLIASVSDRH